MTTPTSTQPNTTATLPTITLLCRFQRDARAFQEAVQKYYPALPQKTKINIQNSSLAALPSTEIFDAIVSPANSYGFMDGAFDDAISILLSPNPRDISGAGYQWTTRKVQRALYERYRGFLPPGGCVVIDVRKDGEWDDLRRGREIIEGEDGKDGEEHKHGCKFVLLCPTMRVPREVRWDREVVFESVWSMLCAVDDYNREQSEAEQREAAKGKTEQSEAKLQGGRISSILMTPLGTGVGKISEARWAAQCVLAMKYWVEAVEKPEKWGNLQWTDIYGEMAEFIDGSTEL